MEAVILFLNSYPFWQFQCGGEAWRVFRASTSLEYSKPVFGTVHRAWGLHPEASDMPFPISRVMAQRHKPS